MRVVIAEDKTAANFVRSGLPKGDPVIVLVGVRQIEGISFQSGDEVYVVGPIFADTNAVLRRNCVKSPPRVIYYVP